MCLVAISVIDFSTFYTQSNDIITNYNLITSSSVMLAEVQKLSYNIRTLILLNMGV